MMTWIENPIQILCDKIDRDCFGFALLYYKLLELQGKPCALLELAVSNPDVS